MRKYFVISGFAAVMIAASSVARAGAGEGSTSARSGTSSSYKVPTFTLDQAILTALQRNPTLLIAEQEIKRTKGVIIQVSAQALPNIGSSAEFQWTDPKLGTSGGGIVGGASAAQNLRSDLFYTIRVTGTQLIFNGTTFNQIRGTFFQRDSAYFGFRNTLDQLLATVKTQFYQVVVNRELIDVQQQSVNLLEQQLKDQQNRFEAGTVPRFNVLQAEVALYNQIPLLITAQNNYRISKINLAKTIGLDFQPRRGENPPLEVVGEMPYTPRTIALADAIELGKERRPFLKQARATVLNQLQQVRAAAGQWLPNITTTGGGEWVSSPTNSSWHDLSKGWVATVQGSLPIWDSGAIAGQVIQQRALLSEAKDTYDDDVRQVELEIQQAYSNLQQNTELIKSQEKNVNLAEEALRLAKARLDAGAGVQLDVLNAQVQLLTAQTTQLQALFGYNSSLAEFDRATGAQSTYTESFANLTPRATKTKTYYTGSGVDAEGKPKRADDTEVRTSAGRSRTSYSK
ncbi:MAG TPA: TolC family protein [Candidatus Binatus sp.]|nr:TolC family protein [Candidatus Binatus sp.]